MLFTKSLNVDNHIAYKLFVVGKTRRCVYTCAKPIGKCMLPYAIYLILMDAINNWYVSPLSSYRDQCAILLAKISGILGTGGEMAAQIN